METLPIEIILTIITSLPAPDCLRLVQTCKSYSWVMAETVIWKHYAWRDRNFQPSEFELQREFLQIEPYRLYKYISQCRHSEKPDRATARIRCYRYVLPGSLWCYSHETKVP
jgi:hypothetical protein